MLKVEIKKGNIEKGLKELKAKIVKTKQNNILFNKKEFIKLSVRKRSQIKKSYIHSKTKTKTRLKIFF